MLASIVAEPTNTKRNTYSIWCVLFVILEEHMRSYSDIHTFSLCITTWCWLLSQLNCSRQLIAFRRKCCCCAKRNQIDLSVFRQLSISNRHEQTSLLSIPGRISSSNTIKMRFYQFFQMKFGWSAKHGIFKIIMNQTIEANNLRLISNHHLANLEIVFSMSPRSHHISLGRNSWQSVHWNGIWP